MAKKINPERRHGLWSRVFKNEMAEKKNFGTGRKKKNKLGVKISLVNDISAQTKKGISRSRKKSTVSKRNYDDLQNNWEG